MMTVAPSLWKALAISLPAPVTMHNLSESLFIFRCPLNMEIQGNLYE